jgi:hypothetical protein
VKQGGKIPPLNARLTLNFLRIGQEFDSWPLM